MATVLERQPGTHRPTLTIVPQQPCWSTRRDGSDRGGAMGREGRARYGNTGKHGINAYRVLREVAGEILATSDLRHVLDRCGTLVQDLLRSDACSISLLDEAAGALVPLLTLASGRSAPVAPLSLDLLNGRMRDAIKEGRSLVVAHSMVIDGDAPLPLTETQSALTAMLIPLPLGQAPLGILWVGRIHGEPFTPEDQELAEALAALIVLGLRGTTAFVRSQEVASREVVP